MLVEFKVGNFRSLRDEVCLSMESAALASDEANSYLDSENSFVYQGLSLLKSAVLYGANASGKSNLLKALNFMRDFVLHSSLDSHSEKPIAIEAFSLDTVSRAKPTLFEVSFFAEKVHYRYGFRIDREIVQQEWLYHTVHEHESRLFFREQQKIELASQFAEGGIIYDNNLLRENALFISVVANFNGAISRSIVRWFESLMILSGVDMSLAYGVSLNTLRANPYLAKQVADFVNKMDVAINDIQIEDNPLDGKPFRIIATEIQTMLQQGNILAEPQSRTVVKTMHNVYNESGEVVNSRDFELHQHESEGTKKLFALATPILLALQESRILIVDELDARFHPLLTKVIVQLFNSSSTNPHHGQLIFATHDVHLLDARLFRRDQIWFTAKDASETTELYSLVDFEVARETSLTQNYLYGKYDALPFVYDIIPLLRSFHNDSKISDTNTMKKADDG